jgi:DNA-binding transcriptional regulator YiaG
MTMKAQHEPIPRGRVVTSYDVDTLGAPFRVTVRDSVTVIQDPDTGEERVQIPDLVGLISAVVRTRVLHPRKLRFDEIKFIRKALGVRAKSLATFLDVTPEHLSRCESGAKVMSSQDERIFRLFAFVATTYKDPQELLERMGDEVEPERKQELREAEIPNFIRRFLRLKIQTLHNAEDELQFEFTRCQSDSSTRKGLDDECWITEPTMAA